MSRSMDRSLIVLIHIGLITITTMALTIVLSIIVDFTTLGESHFVWPSLVLLQTP